MLKSILKIPFVLLSVAAAAHAGPYYDLGIGTSSATLKVSGVIKVAASSATYNTPVITLDGAAAKATIPEVHSAKSGPIFSWETGGATQSAIQGNFEYEGVNGFTIYDYQNSGNGRLGLGTPYGPQLYGLGGLLNPRLGLNNSSPKYALDVTGGAHFTSSATADAGFYGVLYGNADTATTATTATNNVLKVGDTMTGPLVVTSSITANTFYGDGSHLTGVSTSGGSTSTAAYDGAPIGTFINYGSTIPPAGYLYCDGTNYSTTTYSALFNVIGYKYSGYAVSSGPVFTCDFRGMFSRGLDTAKLRDSEYRVIGSTESDAFQAFKLRTTAGSASANGGSFNAEFGGSASTLSGLGGYSAIGTYYPTYTGSFAEYPTYGTPRTGPETRPMNVAVAVMVKYANPLVVNLSTIAIANMTNTFTGANTFTGSVTVSSLTVPASGNNTENYYEQDTVGNSFSVNNSTWTNVNYNFQVSAPWSMFSASTKRITVPASGFWCFSAHVGWAANSSGYRYLALVKNAECGDTGPSHFGGDSRVPVGNTTVQHGTMACTYLNANEYVKVCVMQTSGVALASASDYENSLSIWRQSK